MRTLSVDETGFVSGGLTAAHADGGGDSMMIVPNDFHRRNPFWFVLSDVNNDGIQDEEIVITADRSQDSQYFGANEQGWRSRDGCLAFHTNQMLNHLGQNFVDGVIAGAAAGLHTNGPPGAFLEGIMGAFAGLTYGAITAPNPGQECPPEADPDPRG